MPVLPGSWQFFTPDEAMTVEATVDCSFPPTTSALAARRRDALFTSTGS
ncbi:hypothetical protein [Phyllobacterium sophorae]|nr:hypothetical protein [Phyllobacterium sophorae]